MQDERRTHEYRKLLVCHLFAKFPWTEGAELFFRDYMPEILVDGEPANDPRYLDLEVYIARVLMGCLTVESLQRHCEIGNFGKRVELPGDSLMLQLRTHQAAGLLPRTDEAKGGK